VNGVPEMGNVWEPASTPAMVILNMQHNLV